MFLRHFSYLTSGDNYKDVDLPTAISTTTTEFTIGRCGDITTLTTHTICAQGSFAIGGGAQTCTHTRDCNGGILDTIATTHVDLTRDDTVYVIFGGREGVFGTIFGRFFYVGVIGTRVVYGFGGTVFVCHTQYTRANT